MTDETDQLTVHLLPDYTRTNPYQRKLATSLREQQVKTRLTDGGGGLFPILRGVLGHERPDVLHVHFFHQFLISSSEYLTGLVSLLMGLRTLFELLVLRALGVSLVWTAHDLVNHERRSVRVEKVFKHLFVRFLIDDVVLHCSNARDLLLDFYRLPTHVEERFTVVPHGNYLEEYPNTVTQREAREALDIPPGAFVYCFFGTIRRYKNVPALVRAFEALDRDNTFLLIAGNPRTSERATEVLTAISQDEQVRTIFEYVPDDDIQYYMNAADVVILPFRADEPSMLTSGSVLLAMCFGKPVVAPDIGCIGDYLGKNGGIHYNPENPAGLRSALKAAIEADTEAMGRRNYNMAQRFTWDSIAAQTRAVYERSQYPERGTTEA